MQTLVIGDIHGCYDEFQSLLDKAGLADTDTIISLGDCVDRGPQTPEVLRFFRERPNTRLLMGNHERKHIRGDRHEVKLARSQQTSKIQFGDAYPDALAFMNGLPLYLDPFSTLKTLIHLTLQKTSSYLRDPCGQIAANTPSPSPMLLGLSNWTT